MPERDPRVRNTGFWGWIEREYYKLADSPRRRANALRITWYVSMAVVVLGIVVIALTYAQAAAAGVPPQRYEITARASDDENVWTITQTVELASAPAPAPVDGVPFWLPDDARSLVLDAEPDALLSFTHESDERIRVHARGDVRVVLVTFTISRFGGLPDLAVPGPAETLHATLHLTPGSARPAAGFDRAPDVAGREAWTRTVAPVAAGDAVALTLPPPRPPGALALVAQLAGVSALALAGGAIYAARRAPRADGERTMGLVEHLRELQARLLPVVIAFALAAAFFFTFGIARMNVRGVDVPVIVPTIEGAAASTAFRVLAHQFAPPGVTLVVLSPGDAALAQILMGLVLAFLAVLPLLAWQVAAFLGPGMLAKEKRVAARAVPVVLLLFALGLAFAWTLMVPLTIDVLYSYAGALGATPLLTVDALAKFSAIMLLLFGVTFELPVVMVALARLGVVSAHGFASKWRHAVVAIFVLAAVVTPDGTGITMVILGVPLVVLYGLGVAAAKVAEKPAA